MKKLREKLNAKLSKNGGFTLVEMLIVVAIIAILIAVSIPLISNSLDEAKRATDAANLRSAQALGMIEYLTRGSAADGKYYYHILDNKSGILKNDTAGAPDPYGHIEGDYMEVVIDHDNTDETQIVVADWK